MSAQINELVTLAQGGDAEAFGELYELYYKEMFCYACCITGNEDLAQDAISDAVLSAFKQIKSLRNPDVFKGWLFKILCAACKRHYTENQHKKSFVYLDDGEKDYPGSDGFDGIELSVDLRKALSSLSKEEQEIVLLSVVSNYKSHEIADILELSASTVRSKLNRALKKLRKSLENSERKGW